MNLLPSEWLFRILSRRLLYEEYFLCALWLYWKAVVPAWALIVLSTSALVFWDDPLFICYYSCFSEIAGRLFPCNFALFDCSRLLVFSISSLSSLKSVPSRVFRFGSQFANFALNCLYKVSFVNTGLQGFFIKFRCSRFGHFILRDWRVVWSFYSWL